MFQVFAESTSVDTKIFRNMDDARQWVMADGSTPGLPAAS